MEQTRCDFIEKIGLIAQNDGLPRSAGRLLGLLVWDGTAVAFADLADQLQVSRGSISTASRILEARRLIKRVAKPGQRQDYFQLADDPYANMLQSVAVGLDVARAEIDATLGDIPEGEAAIKGRVAAYAAFYTQLSGAIATILDDRA
jgi:DNA-binding transcriptional regulator GbsR (MarR family)